MQYYGRTFMKRKYILLFLLSFAIALFILDRIAAALHVPNEEDRAIRIYTTSWCPYCNSLRIYLRAMNVPFEDYDTEKSVAGVMGFWALRAHGVPVSVIGPHIIYGYDIQKIEGALQELGYRQEFTPE